MSTRTTRRTITYRYWGEPVKVEMSEAIYRDDERQATRLGMPVAKVIQRDVRPHVLAVKQARRKHTL